MSDGGWTSPGADPRPPASGPAPVTPPSVADGAGTWAPPTAAPQPPSSTWAPPPSTPQSAPPPGSPTGWTPPPKPGLIPLRPLSFGTLLLAPFQVLRHSKALIGLALALQFAVLVVSAVLVFGVIFGLAFRITDPSASDQQPLIAGTIAAAVLAGIALFAVSLVVGALLQGVVVVDVARATVGRRSTLRVLWRRVKPRLWPLVGWTALVGVAVVVIILVVVGLALVGLAFSDGLGLVVSIPIALVVGLGAFVGFVFLSIKLSLVPSALTLEGITLRGALRRSWALTIGHFWRTLGAQFLVGFIVSTAGQIITTPVSLLPLLGVVIDPNETGASIALSIISTVLSGVLSIVIGAVSSIVVSATTALIYLDLRMRKEGLDLVLQRHIERVAAGTAGDDDPFAPGSA